MKFLFRFDWTLAARGDAYMKLHEIQFHFHEVPHSVTEDKLRRRLRPRMCIEHFSQELPFLEDEHEDEDEKNQIRSHAFAPASAG